MFAILMLFKPTKCSRCMEVMDAGQIAMRGFGTFGAAMATQVFYHPMCAADVDASRTHLTLVDNKTAFSDRDQVEALCRQRLQGKKALSEARAKAKRSGKSVETPSVEPARDRKGRPRVRVFLAGSLFSERERVNELASVAPELCFASALREYVFLEFVKITRAPLDDDPSQPVIGAVFASITTVRLMPVQKDKFAAWKTLGVGTPLLWVIDFRNDQALVDKRVLELRAALESAGYVGDEAQVVVSARIDAAALQALVLAMDEGLGLLAGHRDAVDPAKNAADQLASVLESRDTGAYAATIHAAKRCVRGAHATVKTRLVQDALRAAAHGPAVTVALELLLAMYEAGVTSFPLAAREVTLERVPAIVDELVMNPGALRAFPPALDTAMRLLERLEFRGRWGLLLPAYCAAKLTETRRKALEAWLVRCSDRTTQASLRSWAESLSDKQAERRASALALVASMEEACREVEIASVVARPTVAALAPSDGRVPSKSTVN
ncbi:MAG: hypothetical protein Q8Q09_11015 [Deltaproteobacteria bacterium]|nr:hypothetical protein [Deltaproteobacteria bacterium]